jgi:hypothetical protein
VNIDPRFFRVAALCSLLSVATTLMLIFLPELLPPAPDFEARMARVHLAAYQARAWAYLLHPFLVFTAALGLALALAKRAPVLAMTGMAGFLLWAFNEAGQQTLTLFAFDRWREAWATADETVRAALRVNAVMYDGIWDGMYMLLLIGFAIGNACLGTALWADAASTDPRLGRLVAGLMMAVVLLTGLLFAGELDFRPLPEFLLEWSYPAIQPLARTLIAVWLWRFSCRIHPP